MNTKVAIIDDMLPPYRIPLYNYLNNTDSKVSFDVLLSSMKQGDRSWDVKDENIKFEYYLFDGLYLNIKTKQSRMGVYHFHFNPKLIQWLLAKKYDVVIISGYSSLTHQLAIIACKYLNIPTIIWYRSFDESDTYLRRILNTYLRSILKMAKAFFVPGSKSENYLARTIDLNNRKIVQVANPVDNKFYLSQFNKSEDRAKGNRVRVLFVGRLIESKGVLDLLIAHEMLLSETRISQYELCIVGDGLLQSRIDTLISERGLSNVTVIGHLDKYTLCDEYRRADIFVLPSHYEPWGLVVNEAMLFNLPIITTHGIGAAGVIALDGVNGYLVNPQKPDDLAKALKKLIDSPSLRNKMGIKSGEIISSYGFEYTGNKFLKTVKDLIVDA